jgi:hypothetical protein
MVLKGRRIAPSTTVKILYLVVLGTSILYVRNVLNTDSFKATEKTTAKPVINPHEVSVSLVAVFDAETKEYKAKLTSTDSVENLLKELRDKQDLIYEKDLYTYGAEIVSVFGKEADDNKKWAVFLGNVDITNNIASKNLVDDAAYTLKQVEK